MEPGVGITIWRGSAIALLCAEDAGGELVLRHRSFNESRSCGNDYVTGQGIRVEESSCYRSQLNVTVDSRLDNKTIECIYDNGNTSIVIGTSPVEITKGIIAKFNGVYYHSLYSNQD